MFIYRASLKWKGCIQKNEEMCLMGPWGGCAHNRREEFILRPEIISITHIQQENPSLSQSSFTVNHPWCPAHHPFHISSSSVFIPPRGARAAAERPERGEAAKGLPAVYCLFIFNGCFMAAHEKKIDGLLFSFDERSPFTTLLSKMFWKWKKLAAQPPAVHRLLFARLRAPAAETLRSTEGVRNQTPHTE